MAIELDFTFDDKTYRHYTNGVMTVMHCHHYMTLLTRLAEKFDEIGGRRILAESAEDATRPLIDAYVQKHRIEDPAARLQVGADYYAAMGMGRMTASGKTKQGEAMLTTSHIDQGWLMKFGSADEPLNHWTCGYLAGMFAAAFDQPPRSYSVEEVESLVKGDQESRFLVQAIAI